MASAVVVGLSENRLKVSFVGRPELAEGQARLLFINILGFGMKEGEAAYISSSLPTPSLLREVLSFLEQEEIPYELDAPIKTLIRSHESDARSLEEAMQTGRELRAKPAREFICPELVRPLQPYQIPAAKHMADVTHAANFSVPGAGKTTITLAAFANLRAKGIVEFLMVIGPNSSFMSWEDEWLASYGRKPRVVRISGPRSTRHRLYEEAANAELVLVGYHTMGLDVD